MKRSYLAYIIVWTMVAVSLALSTSGCTASEPAAISPNPTLQEKIDDLTAAIEKAGEPGDEVRAFKALLALDQAAGKDKAESVRQLVWHHSRARDVTAGMTIFFPLRFLEVSPGDMVIAVAPVIGATDDPEIEQACKEVTAVIEDYDHTRGYDFSRYEAYLRGKYGRKSEVEPGLVEHMFRRSPGQALQSYTMVVYQDERRKPLLWARHIVDDALWKRRYGFVPPKAAPDAAVTEQLEKMAGREEWWARLYAAEVIRQHPELSNDELIKVMSGDPHPLVQETAKAIKRRKSN